MAPKPPVRPRTFFARKKLTKKEIALGRQVARYMAPRPTSRAECLGHDGPCPFAGCRHHTGIEVNEIGSLKIMWPGYEVDEIPETCSLDVAERGPQTVEAVAKILNISTEWVRAIEGIALAKLRERLADGAPASATPAPRKRLTVLREGAG